MGRYDNAQQARGSSSGHAVEIEFRSARRLPPPAIQWPPAAQITVRTVSRNGSGHYERLIRLEYHSATYRRRQDKSTDHPVVSHQRQQPARLTVMEYLV